jgi:hypothetical protein
VDSFRLDVWDCQGCYLVWSLCTLFSGALPDVQTEGMRCTECDADLVARDSVLVSELAEWERFFGLTLHSGWRTHLPAEFDTGLARGLTA